MRSINVTMWVTLDGVVQGLGRPNEAPAPFPSQRPQVVHEQRQPPGRRQDEQIDAHLTF